MKPLISHDCSLFVFRFSYLRTKELKSSRVESGSLHGLEKKSGVFGVEEIALLRSAHPFIAI